MNLFSVCDKAQDIQLVPSSDLDKIRYIIIVKVARGKNSSFKMMNLDWSGVARELMEVKWWLWMPVLANIETPSDSLCVSVHGNIANDPRW